MRLTIYSAALVLTLTAASACAPDSTLDPSDRPDPPPAGAFDLDLSFFDENEPAPGGATTSWGQALQTVAFARSEMGILEVPEAMLRSATSAQGIRDGSSWRWPFDTSVDGDRYHGELRSSVVGNQYEWELIVNAPDHSPLLSNYLWALGFTPPANYEGLWRIADAEAGTDSLVAQLSWIRNPDNGINFAFSASDSAGWRFDRSLAGNVLTYYVYNSPHRRITWFPNGTGSTWTIATMTACWNGDKQDIAC